MCAQQHQQFQEYPVQHSLDTDPFEPTRKEGSVVEVSEKDDTDETRNLVNRRCTRRFGSDREGRTKGELPKSYEFRHLELLFSICALGDWQAFPDNQQAVPESSICWVDSMDHLACQSKSSTCEAESLWNR